MRKMLISATMMVGLSVLLVGCGNEPNTGETSLAGMEFTERNQARLEAAVPPVELKDSLERRNLAKYNNYWNDPTRESYLYLLSRSGTVIAEHVIVGKVTYCSSKMTTREQVITVGSSTSGAGKTRHVIESPGLDGSFGPSEDAIFFFTAQAPDAPCTWKGDYFLSPVPATLTTKPVLVRNVTGK